MEIGGNMVGQSDVDREQSGNNANIGWDIWQPDTSRLDWGTSTSTSYNTSTATSVTVAAGSFNTTRQDTSPARELELPHHGHILHHHHLHYCYQLDDQQRPSLYSGDGSHCHPDPHLTCLKLGKRQYFEDATLLEDQHVAGLSSIGKRGKPYYSGGVGGFGGPSSSASSSSLPATVPRCQVEGCHVVLINAKDYHRRHKVCDMHSKAPKVVVLGLEQRFCQQCSRFHPVSEFDDSKRSCRRRLAGHNERRRKSAHDSSNKNSAQGPYLSLPTGRALSLLSSKADSWVSPADLSSRSSAALSELIAEHRAAILDRQFILDRDWYTQNRVMEDLSETNPRSNPLIPHQHQMLSESHNWNRFQENDTHVTLDLMHASSSAFGLLSVREKRKEEEHESCSNLWNSFHGAPVV